MVAKSKSTAAKTTAAADAERPADAGAPPRVKGPTMKIKDLVDQVTSATGGKKKDVKGLVEATLTALGDALTRGEDLNLPGLGRTRIARTTERDGASMMTLKVRRGAHRKKDGTEPLADDEVDG